MNYVMVFAQSWKFGFNDSSLIAWVIVFAYFTAAYYCWRAHGNAIITETQGTRSPWIALALSLGFLGVNKQLDLHKWLMETGRSLAAEQDGQFRLLLLATGLVACVGLIVALLRGGTLSRGKRIFRLSNLRQRWAFVVLAGLLGAKIARFQPGPISDILLSHVFTEEEGLLHIHILELLELGCVGAIAMLARIPIDRPV